MFPNVFCINSDCIFSTFWQFFVVNYFYWKYNEARNGSLHKTGRITSLLKRLEWLGLCNQGNRCVTVVTHASENVKDCRETLASDYVYTYQSCTTWKYHQRQYNVYISLCKYINSYNNILLLLYITFLTQRKIVTDPHWLTGWDVPWCGKVSRVSSLLEMSHTTRWCWMHTLAPPVHRVAPLIPTECLCFLC